MDQEDTESGKVAKPFIEDIRKALTGLEAALENLNEVVCNETSGELSLKISKIKGRQSYDLSALLACHLCSQRFKTEAGT